LREIKIVPNTTRKYHAHKAKSPEGDRRFYARVNDVDLLANINGRLVEVLDISLSGVRVSNGFPLNGEMVDFTLIPRVGVRLDVNRSVKVRGKAVRVNDDEHFVAIVFEQMSYSLAKMIISTLSERLGVKPFLLG